MNIFLLIGVALNNLRANKLRSLLTMLGIIIGVSAVIMMVGIMQGLSHKITTEFSKLGSDLIIVAYSPTPEERKTITQRIEGLKMGDVQAIREKCDLIKSLSPELPLGGSSTAKYAGKSLDVTGDGVLPDYERLRNVKIAHGRFINNDDAGSWAKVCVIGDKVRTELFPNSDPIGQNVELGVGANSISLTVVGVAEPKGRTFEGDADKMLFLPLPTAQKRLLGSETVGVVYGQPIDLNHMNAAKDQVWQLLMTRYKNLPGWKVDSFDNMLGSITSVFAVFTLVLGSIAGLALLVGGIGIMNIMLVSVTERTREIGVRKAIGAKRSDILRQFLVESAALSGVGGLLGVTIGTSMAYFVGFLTTFIPQFDDKQGGTKGLAIFVPPWVIIGSFVFSAGVGVFFGMYPAIRASRLDPITALRHE